MTKVALSVAEKPSVAKELANILSKGRSQRRQGSTPYNAIFEFPCEVNGQNYTMKMTSVAGHLMELDFPEPYKGWNSCSFRDLFTLPVRKRVPEDKQALYDQLQRESRRASLLILWLDCDLEGENIAFEVANACLESNSRLTVLRATFSALIPRDIHRAMRSLHPPDERLAQAVDARQEIDLRLGAAFTRFQTKRLRDKYEGLSGILSYGPCQFPTLGFVVERYNKIQAFKAENFWSMHVDYEAPDRDSRDGVARATFSWKRGTLFDRLACLILFEMCLDDSVARVTSINARDTSRTKPTPLATVELQKRASRFLHLSSERTMHVAEELYQRGIISYPRTETEIFSDGFDLMGMVQEHTNHEMWGEYATRLVNGGYEKPRAGRNDDKAHPPIHPTKCVDLASLNDDQRKIYELVVRHFLACCSRDAKGFQTTVTIDVASEQFTTTGLMILERNWFDIYRYEHWSGTNIPCFQEGQTFVPKAIQMTEGRTHAPPLLSESDLIGEMDRNGIGTDATIAEHIHKIQVRQYAEKDESSRFKPTALGLALVEGYNNMGYQLNKPYIRASMELETKRIARGELDKETMLRNCLEQMQQCFDAVTREAKKLDDAIGHHFAKHGQGEDYKVLRRNMVRCGHCQNGMDLKHKRVPGRRKADPSEQPRFLFCDECQVAHMMPRTGVLEPTDHICPLCAFQVVKVSPGEGYTRQEYTVCPFCFANGGGDDEASGMMQCYRCSADCPLAGRKSGSATICTCSVCGVGRIGIRKTPKGDYVAGCSNYPTCKNSVWMPKAISSISVAAEEQCPNCTQLSGGPVLKVKVQYGRSLVPPGTVLEQTCCACCDPLWREMAWPTVQLHRAGHRNASTREPENIPPATNAGSGSGSGSGSGGIDYMGAMRGEGFETRGRGKQTARGRTAAPPAAQQPRAQRAGGNASTMGAETGADAATCQCGLPAVIRTVNKESQNKGRQFFACSKSREEGCGFFSWCDESQQGASSARPSGRPANRPAAAQDGAPGIVCFKCQQPGHFARQCPNDPSAKRQRF